MACNTGPQVIRVGKDNCNFCKMAIGSNRYGAEIISVKGKIFKYDELHCLLKDISSETISKANIKEIYFTDFCGQHNLINCEEAYFLSSDKLMSPMGGNIAAFKSQDSLLLVQKKYMGNQILWNEIYTNLK